MVGALERSMHASHTGRLVDGRCQLDGGVNTYRVVAGRYLRQCAYDKLIKRTLGEVLEQKSTQHGHHTRAQKYICPSGRLNGRLPTAIEGVFKRLNRRLPTATECVFNEVQIELSLCQMDQPLIR